MGLLNERTKTVIITGQEWTLHPEKAIFWREEQLLIVTDIHLGKSGHFRKSGIAAPGGINKKNLDRLANLIESFEPVELLILGDLFHSDANKDWLEFEEWRNSLPDLKITLVTGNHDVLHHSFYESGNIQTTPVLKRGTFTFKHHHDIDSESDSIVVSGHIHPAVKVKVKGRQSIKVPCFLFRKNHVLLPAFGEFTGTYIIKPDETDHIYGVVENNIITLKNLVS